MPAPPTPRVAAMNASSGRDTFRFRMAPPGVVPVRLAPRPAVPPPRAGSRAAVAGADVASTRRASATEAFFKTDSSWGFRHRRRRAAAARAPLWSGAELLPVDRPHLALHVPLVAVHREKAFGELAGLLERGGFQDRVAADHLFRLGEGAL